MQDMGLTPIAEKAYRYMKDHNMVGEDNMDSADRIVHGLKMPKNQVMNGLQELLKKGLAKKRSREKYTGYYLNKTDN